MAGLNLRFTPLATDGIRDPAEAATWGTLSIDLESETGARRSLTRVHDKRANADRDGVDGTVLPLAEWLTRNWFVLFESERVPPAVDTPRRAAYRWMRSHCLRFAGEGAALPNLCLYRASDRLAGVQWSRDTATSTTWEPVDFLGEDGNEELPREGLRASLTEFVDLVVRRCELLAPESPRTIELRRAWACVLDPRHPDHRLAIIAARLDESITRLTPEVRQKLLALSGSGDPVLDALLERGDVEQLEQLSAAVAHVSAALSPSPRASPLLADLRKRLTPAVATSDWMRGWADARAFRSALGRPDDQPLEPLAEAGNERADSLLGLLHDRDALVAWEPEAEPAVFATQPQSRFYKHRNSWPAVFFGSATTRSACLLSPGLGGLTPVANAFATELVAPRERVQRELAGRTLVDGELIHEIANTMNAPWQCVKHQLQNHGLAQVRV